MRVSISYSLHEDWSSLGFFSSPLHEPCPWNNFEYIIQKIIRCPNTTFSPCPSHSYNLPITGVSLSPVILLGSPLIPSLLNILQMKPLKFCNQCFCDSCHCIYYSIQNVVDLLTRWEESTRSKGESLDFQRCPDSWNVWWKLVPLSPKVQMIKYY